MAVYTIRFGGTYYIPGREVAEEETAEERGRTKPKAAETDRAGTRAGEEGGRREGERWRKERKIDRCFLGLRRAYCVILATVAAATAGIIIILKGGQNTGPESHNAEFYDFWHRGDATGCNAAFYAPLTAPDLISRPEMNGFSKRPSDRNVTWPRRVQLEQPACAGLRVCAKRSRFRPIRSVLPIR